ncbi:hypothetical protein Q5Y75_27515 [Ruegeria sp. 2205SS24-7]|nr:hypothetical protein [Ruegeria sp. 2205SS24-7]MDP5220939.1 hypothetical protein [Ruegeria sp. 2205SS24-7]
MSFNDLAKKEAADKKASQDKDTASTTQSDESPATGTKPVDPSKN